MSLYENGILDIVVTDRTRQQACPRIQLPKRVNVRLGGLNGDAEAKGHITFMVVMVRCRCGDTSYRASNGSCLCKDAGSG